MSQIITSDKSYLDRIGKYQKPTMQEQGFDNDAPICPYCQQSKKQMGRYWVCPCTGKQIFSKSGISAKKSLKFKS